MNINANLTAGSVWITVLLPVLSRLFIRQPKHVTQLIVTRGSTAISRAAQHADTRRVPLITHQISESGVQHTRDHCLPVNQNIIMS